MRAQALFPFTAEACVTAVPQQSFATYERYVPGFHFLAGGLILTNLVWAIVRFASVRDGATGIGLLSAASLPLLFWYTRSFPIAVQDRLICLEERLRLGRLLPPDLQARIGDFSPGQLIAMRFASDGELPDLARRVLMDNITSRVSIMQMIRTWKPDYLRA